MAEKLSESLIEKEEKNFLKSLGKELGKLANEGIEFTLPWAVIDHVANTERNLGFIRSKINRHAREGVKEGDGLTLYKVRKVRVPVEEEGRAIIRTELMIILKCQISDAHHAIYRDLIQTVATELRIGVYTFDTRGCKYPDRTMCSVPVDVQQIRDRLRINTSILNPIYIDNKEDRARPENRPHLIKIKGGYPVEKIIGVADLPVYHSTTKTQQILSTPNRPSGPLLEEKGPAIVSHQVEPRQQPERLHAIENLPDQASQPIMVPSTPERPSGPSLEEKNSSRNPQTQPTIRSEQFQNTRTQDARIIQMQSQSLINNEDSNKRVAPFSHKDVQVPEKLGTRHECKSSIHRRDIGQGQARISKPPNYSRINSTIKLVRPTFQPAIQQASVQPTSSYATVVKSNLNTKFEATSRSTLRSTSDVQHQVTTEHKAPFKLVPVMPPTKADAAKSCTTTSVQSNQIHKGRAN